MPLQVALARLGRSLLGIQCGAVHVEAIDEEELVGRLSKTEVLDGQGIWIAEAIGRLETGEITFHEGDQRQADHASLAQSLGLRQLL